MLSANSGCRYELETVFENILRYSSNSNYLIYGLLA